MTSSLAYCGQHKLLESTTTSEFQLQLTLSQEPPGPKSTKYCSKCKTQKELSEFNYYKGSCDGRQPYCRPCAKAYHKQYKKARDAAPPETPCCICGSEENLRMDHDHVTGRFRGWLCHRHNIALGMIGDSIEELLQAIDYLSTTSTEE